MEKYLVPWRCLIDDPPSSVPIENQAEPSKNNTNPISKTVQPDHGATSKKTTLIRSKSPPTGLSYHKSLY